MSKLLSAATATGAGSRLARKPGLTSVQAYGTTSAGAGAATVAIEVSNDPDNAGWIVAGTIALTLATTSSTDGLNINAAWRYVRANLTAISGTNASVTVVV